jgi:23S rRNA A2030 N6-methylase RlmJ
VCVSLHAGVHKNLLRHSTLNKLLAVTKSKEKKEGTIWPWAGTGRSVSLSTAIMNENTPVSPQMLHH